MNTSLIKAVQSRVGTTVDGIVGLNTRKAIANYINTDNNWKAIQKKVGSKADGIFGPNTLNAVAAYLGVLNGKESKSTFSCSQASVRACTSVFGKPGVESNLISVKVPANYPITYEGTKVKTIRIHKAVAKELEEILQEIGDTYEKKYGKDWNKKAPAICVYNGSYNARKTRGGSSWSIHAWGCALDFDASDATLAKRYKDCRLSQPIYEDFWRIWEEYGWHSLGREKDYDTMHIQKPYF